MNTRDRSAEDPIPQAEQASAFTSELAEEARLVAHVFGELTEDEAQNVRGELAQSVELGREHATLAATAALVKSTLPADALPAGLRETLLLAARREQHALQMRAKFRVLPGGVTRAAMGLAIAALALLVWKPQRIPSRASSQQDSSPGMEIASRAIHLDQETGHLDQETGHLDQETGDDLYFLGQESGQVALRIQEKQPLEEPSFEPTLEPAGTTLGLGLMMGESRALSRPRTETATILSATTGADFNSGFEVGGLQAQIKDEIQAPNRAGLRGIGYVEDAVEDAREIAKDSVDKNANENSAVASGRDREAQGAVLRTRQPLAAEAATRQVLAERVLDSLEPVPSENAAQLFFRYWGDNPWVSVDDSGLSTFAADVDTGSFGVVRRLLRAGRLPRPEQVRTEELINWWRPDVLAPSDGSTFRVVMEAAPSRFHADPDVALLRVALRGRDVDRRDRKPLALTFVVDVSGSMDDHGRIGLVRDSLQLLLLELSTTDSVALVTFDTAAHTLVPMQSAASRGPFEDALARIDPEGDTSVESGLVAGFRLAAQELTPGAVNRVVFLSDGVGNIGETDQLRILELVAEERSRGIYLSTIGVGYGVDASEDYADDFLEQLADKGDGLYHNINDRADAERYLVDQFTSSLEPIARDVKIQVEFDPDQVASWRQLGYENRALRADEFRDNNVDGGEVHAGHQVNALYELRLRPGLASEKPLATAHVRWKPPFAIDALDGSDAGREAAEDASEIEQAFLAADLARDFSDTSLGYRRAVVVAQLAEILRRSEHASGDAPIDLLAAMEDLAPFLADPDFDELLGLLHDVRPALLALADELGPIDLTINTIRRQQVEMLRRQEELARTNQEESRRQLQTEIESARAKIKGLEAQLRELLEKKVGPSTGDR